MICNTKRLLDADVFSAAHHLEARIKQNDAGSEAAALSELKRMARDLLDALEKLRKHEAEHNCM